MVDDGMFDEERPESGEVNAAADDAAATRPGEPSGGSEAEGNAAECAAECAAKRPRGEDENR